jgi:hypothetical protein
MSRMGTKFLERRNLVANSGFDSLAEKAQTGAGELAGTTSGADGIEEDFVLWRFSQTIA